MRGRASRATLAWLKLWARYVCVFPFAGYTCIRNVRVCMHMSARATRFFRRPRRWLFPDFAAWESRRCILRCLNSANAVIQRRIVTTFRALLPFFAAAYHRLVPAYADDRIDRSFVVLPMTWRFMITLCITLSRNVLRPTRVDRLQRFVYARRITGNHLYLRKSMLFILHQKDY